jgi:hypothetical protein
MKQGMFSFLSAVQGLDVLSDGVIERCKTFQEAVAVSRALGKRKPSDKSIAAGLGLQQSVWSRIQNKPKDSPAYLPEHKYGDLCRELGNVGVLQWLASQAGFRLVPVVESRADRLRRELAELEAEEAA